MRDWAGLLDRVLGARLRRLVKRYQKAHPETVCRAWSHTLGEATVYQGYTVGAEFQLQAGTVELVVNLAYLDRSPGFESAEVCWRQPTGEYEYSWPRRIRISTAQEMWRQRRMSRLGKGLPRLWRALKRALQRGCPPPPAKPRGPVFSVPRRLEKPKPAPLEWALDAREPTVHEAVVARLPGLLLNTTHGFEVDEVRRFQAQKRGWKLPAALPVGSARLDEFIEQPGPGEWRELYRQKPGFSGGLFLSRVAFVGDDDAYLCLRRLLGYGDSGSWIRSRSWDASETSWLERWDAPLAAELCDLVRLQRQGKSWRVVDAIDLLGPVPQELQATAVKEAWQSDFRAVEIPPDSKLAAVVVAELELCRMGLALESHPESLKVDAVLKDGRTLRFTVLTMSLNFTETLGPIKRLIVVNGAAPSKIVRAIVAWLELSRLA